MEAIRDGVCGDAAVGDEVGEEVRVRPLHGPVLLRVVVEVVPEQKVQVLRVPRVPVCIVCGDICNMSVINSTEPLCFPSPIKHSDVYLRCKRTKDF